MWIWVVPELHSSPHMQTHEHSGLAIDPAHALLVKPLALGSGEWKEAVFFQSEHGMSVSSFSLATNSQIIAWTLTINHESLAYSLGFSHQFLELRLNHIFINLHSARWLLPFPFYVSDSFCISMVSPGSLIISSSSLCPEVPPISLVQLLAVQFFITLVTAIPLHSAQISQNKLCQGERYDSE